jgi:hypothetical protein
MPFYLAARYQHSQTAEKNEVSVLYKNHEHDPNQTNIILHSETLWRKLKKD